eukprot:7016703-Prymnesium_polylepis.2
MAGGHASASRQGSRETERSPESRCSRAFSDLCTSVAPRCPERTERRSRRRRAAGCRWPRSAQARPRGPDLHIVARSHGVVPQANTPATTRLLAQSDSCKRSTSRELSA